MDFGVDTDGTLERPPVLHLARGMLKRRIRSCIFRKGIDRPRNKNIDFKNADQLLLTQDFIQNLGGKEKKSVLVSDTKGGRFYSGVNFLLLKPLALAPALHP